MSLTQGDFGLASIVQDELSSTMVGTLQYMSPELLSKKPYDPMEADLWALGCVMFELTALKPPFHSFSADGLMKRIAAGSSPSLPAAATLHYSESWRNLVRSMLHKDRDQRPTTIDILSLPFLQMSKERVESRYGPPLPPGAMEKITLVPLSSELRELSDRFKHQELEAELKTAEEKMKTKDSQWKYAPEALKPRFEGEREEAIKILEKVKSRIEREIEIDDLDSNAGPPGLHSFEKSFPRLSKQISQKRISNGLLSSEQEPIEPIRQVVPRHHRRSEPNLQLPSLKVKESTLTSQRNAISRVSLDAKHLNLVQNHGSPAKDANGLPPRPPHGNHALTKSPAKHPPTAALVSSPQVAMVRKYEGHQHLPEIISPSKKTTVAHLPAHPMAQRDPPPQRRWTADNP